MIHTIITDPIVGNIAGIFKNKENQFLNRRIIINNRTFLDKPKF
jgi:hypothetical protein